MGLRLGPLRAYLLSAYSLGKCKYLLQLRLHAARKTLCRLPTSSRGDTQQTLQPTGTKTSGLSKRSWKGQSKHSEGERSQSFDKSNRRFVGAFGSVGHGHGNSSLG